jgi:hypothetical protein
MMLMRTGCGGQSKSISRDAGLTWTTPEPTPLPGTAAPVSASRIPATGVLLVSVDTEHVERPDEMLTPQVETPSAWGRIPQRFCNPYDPHLLRWLIRRQLARAERHDGNEGSVVPSLAFFGWRDASHGGIGRSAAVKSWKPKSFSA